MIVRVASCSCGQLTATATGDPIRVSVCHCLACQRRTGSAFGAQARFRRIDVEIRGDATSYVRIGDSGKKTTFYFCGKCGATVHYDLGSQEDVIAIPLGAFADPGFPHPATSVYEDYKHAWVELPKCVEHMG
jgi:hypothetical protein